MNSRTSKTMLHARACGFTLIELMITVAVLAILVGLAGPNFREAMMNARMTGQANDLMADLNIARSEAVKRNQRVYLCTSNNGTTCTASAWRDGWMIFVDINQNSGWDAATERPLKATPALNRSNNLSVFNDTPGTGGSRFIPYRPSGVSTPAGAEVFFFMCDPRNTASVGAALAQNRGRLIRINTTGRPIVERRTCINAFL